MASFSFTCRSTRSCFIRYQNCRSIRVTTYQTRGHHCDGDTNLGANAGPCDGNPRSVQVDVAQQLLQAGHQYLDVRTREEFRGGHPVGAFNIPYMFRDETGMHKNINFVEQVSSNFEKDAEIIVGCQSGRRSFMAAADMLSPGFTHVTDVAGGYNAWIKNGFPKTE